MKAKLPVLLQHYHFASPVKRREAILILGVVYFGIINRKTGPALHALHLKFVRVSRLNDLS